VGIAAILRGKPSPRLTYQTVFAVHSNAPQNVPQSLRGAESSRQDFGSPQDASLSDQPGTASTAQPQPAQRPTRVCAAEGCGATRGLRSCGGCHIALYCSEACSHAHWRAHRAECRRLQAAVKAGDASAGDGGHS